MRDAGEGQRLEFMAKYPENGYELSREIAGFASSNPGTILIGVSDDGELLGMPGLDSNAARDKLLQRIEGVCSGNIRPAITPIVKFAQENNAIVLAIEVPLGSQPIYYSKHTPYIRHLTRSRPAEPHEVIERIAKWLSVAAIESPEDDAQSDFISSVAQILVTILSLADQFELRNVKPWLDYMHSQASHLADELRELAIEEAAIKMEIHTSLTNIADHLDSAASHRHTLGGDSWTIYAGYWVAAHDSAKKLMDECVNSVPLSDRSQDQIRDLINKTTRQLVDLENRAQAMADDGRMEKLQDEASQIGAQFLKLTYYRIDDIALGLSSELRPLANDLDLIETERLYMDGGQSEQRILDKLHNLTQRIQTDLDVTISISN